MPFLIKQLGTSQEKQIGKNKINGQIKDWIWIQISS